MTESAHAIDCAAALAPDRVADYIGAMLEAVSVRKERIVVIDPDLRARPLWGAESPEPFTIRFTGGAPKGATDIAVYRNVVPAPSIMETAGTLGSGWNPLLEDIALDLVRREYSLAAEPRQLMTWSSPTSITDIHRRHALAGVARTDPELKKRTRQLIADAIRERTESRIAEILRLFADTIARPRDAGVALEEIRHWGFDPRALTGRRLQMLRRYMKNRITGYVAERDYTPAMFPDAASALA